MDKCRLTVLTLGQPPCAVNASLPRQPCVRRRRDEVWKEGRDLFGLHPLFTFVECTSSVCLVCSARSKQVLRMHHETNLDNSNNACLCHRFVQRQQPLQRGGGSPDVCASGGVTCTDTFKPTKPWYQMSMDLIDFTNSRGGRGCGTSSW